MANKPDTFIIKNLQHVEFWTTDCDLDPILLHRDGRLFAIRVTILPVEDPTDEFVADEVPGESEVV